MPSKDPADDFIDDSQQGRAGDNQQDSGELPTSEVPPDQHAGEVDPQDAVAPKPKPLHPQPPKPRPRSATNARQYKGYIVIGALVVLGVGAIIVFAKSKTTATVSAPPHIRPSYDASPDVDAKLERFINVINTAIPEMKKSIEAQGDRVDTNEKLVRDAVSKIEELGRSQDAKFAEQMRRLTQAIDSAGASGSRGSTQGNTGDLDSFLGMLKKQKGTSGLNLAEARIRLGQFLKNQGFDGENLALLRDQSLDQLGFLYVGDVSEAQLSDAELAQLPEDLRDACKALRDYFYANGEFSGRVLLREDDGEKWLRSTYGDARVQAAGGAVSKVIFLARVRKEDVTREMEEMLPDLAADRDKRGIAPGDVYRTEAFVYELKKTRFPAMKPGQHLAMTFALSGLRANGSGDQAPKHRKITADDRSMLEGAGRDAAKFAQAQGGDQGAMLRRAKEAIGTKCTDLRVQASAAEIDAMAINAVATVVRAGQPAEKTPVVTAPTPKTEKTGEPKRRAPGVRLGPIDITQSDAPTLGWLLAIATAERLRLDVGKPADAAALAGMLAASNPLAKASWTAVADRQGDLRLFVSSLIGEYQQIINEARSIALDMPTWKGMSADDAIYVMAIELGRVRGSQLTSDGDTLLKAIGQRRADLAKASPRLVEDLPPASSTGIERFLGTWKALSLPAPHGIDQERLPLVVGILIRQMTERRVAHESVSLERASDLRDQAVRELNDNLLGTVPAVLTMRYDEKLPENLLEQATVAGHNRYAVASLAETILADRGVKVVSERLATAIDRDDLIAPLYTAMASWVPEQVQALLESRKPAITDANIGEVAGEVAGELDLRYQEFIAKRIISGNLTDRLTSKAGSLQKDNLVRALKHLEDELALATMDPVSVKTLDALAIRLHDECMAILNGAGGTSTAGRSGSAPSAGKPSPTRPGVFDVKDEGLPGLPGGSPPVASGRTRAISRGTAFQVYLEIGAVVAVGGKNDFDDRVQLRGRGGFFSPAGKWYPFPPVIFQGHVKSNPSGDRNNVKIESMAIEFPSGRVIEKEITGIVTDEIDGIGGMIADYERNYDKILPEAGLLAVTQGTAAALKSTTNTTTVVVPGATTQNTNVGNAAQQGVGEGLQAGADLLTEYQRQYLSTISPTTETPNGQKLVAYLFSTVEFPEISEEDWASLEGTQHGSSWNGF